MNDIFVIANGESESDKRDKKIELCNVKHKPYKSAQQQVLRNIWNRQKYIEWYSSRIFGWKKPLTEAWRSRGRRGHDISH